MQNIPWHTIPFVRLCIPFVIGILVAIYISLPYHAAMNWWLFVLLPLGILAGKGLAYKYRFVFGYLLFVWLAGVGYVLTLAQNESQRSEHFSHHAAAVGKTVLVGIVTNTPTPKEYTKVELAVSQVAVDTIWKKVEGNLLVYVKNGGGQLPQYGQKVLIQADIKPTQSSLNTFDFDFKKYLFFHRIYHQTFIEGKDWNVRAEHCGNPFFHILYQWRDYCVEILKKHLPTANELTVGEALIIGYRDAIPQEIITTYSTTGAMHVLSVSGLHVGIIVLILKRFVLREKFFRRKWIPALLNILLIWVFAFMSGGSASVLRAALMFSVILLGQAAQRNANIYNNLGVSAFMLLLYDPYLIMDVGFQLSYLGLFGIALLQPYVEQLWLIENKVGWYLWQCTVAGITAQTTTFGITLFRFHQFPTYFWLSGLIVVPAATAILGAGILLFLCSFVGLPDSITFVIGKILYGLLWGTNNSLYLIQNLPKSLLDGIWISSWQTLGIYVALGAFVLSYFFQMKSWFLVGWTVLLLVVLLVPFQTWKQLNQQLLVVHHVRHGCVLDVVEGKQATSWEIRPTEERSKQFSIRNCRSYLGIGAVQTIQKDSIFESEHLKIRYPYLAVGKKLISVSPTFQSADFQLYVAPPYREAKDSLGIHILHPSASYFIKKQFINNFYLHAVNMDTTGTLIFDLKNNY